MGGAQRVQRPRVDQDLRLLAGEAKPASVMVCEDSHLSPGVEGTLSSPDLAGKLFPVVPAGIPLPVGPIGPCGMTSPSDLTFIGPVGAVSDPVGPVGPYISRGPVGSYGTSSPSDSDTPGPATPMRTFPQSHQDGGECMYMHGGWSDSNVAGTPAAVAMVDLRAGSTVTDVLSNVRGP